MKGGRSNRRQKGGGVKRTTRKNVKRRKDVLKKIPEKKNLGLIMNDGS